MIIALLVVRSVIGEKRLTNGVRADLIQRHMHMAEAIAGRYSASHSGIEGDDAAQVAAVAVISAVDSYTALESQTLRDFIARTVENSLMMEFRRGKRRERVAPTQSLSVLGNSEGDPLNSIRDLRSASSLNPRADINNGLREAIGDVRASAVIQCSPAHREHGFYSWSCALSRERVKKMRARQEDTVSRRRQMAQLQKAA